ncbi:MAG: Spy/CpxP family protein refolding chaperone [Deltaproteobacteria bacterium]|nr:Spy/CpxP family protein refolding chaperone [Deltaproteobacteria bacterium]
MKKVLAISFFSIALALFGAAERAYACGGFGGKGKCGMQGHGQGHAQFKEELKLTADQEKALDALKVEHHKEMSQLKDKMQEKHLQLVKALKSDKPDKAAIDALIKEKTQLFGETVRLRTEHFLKVKEVLKPDQQLKFFDFIENHPGPGPKGPCPECPDMPE